MYNTVEKIIVNLVLTLSYAPPVLASGWSNSKAEVLNLSNDTHSLSRLNKNAMVIACSECKKQ